MFWVKFLLEIFEGDEGFGEFDRLGSDGFVDSLNNEINVT